MPSNNFLISTIRIHFKHLMNMFNYFVDYAEELEAKNQQLEMKNQQLEDHAEQLEMKNQQLVVYAEQLEEMNRKLMEEVKQLKGEEKGSSKEEDVNVEKEDWNNSVDNIFVLDSGDEEQPGDGDISVQVINGRPFSSSSSSDNDAEIQNERIKWSESDDGMGLHNTDTNGTLEENVRMFIDDSPFITREEYFRSMHMMLPPSKQ